VERSRSLVLRISDVRDAAMVREFNALAFRPLTVVMSKNFHLHGVPFIELLGDSHNLQPVVSCPFHLCFLIFTLAFTDILHLLF
jgi:hypothetical protein